MEYKNTFEEPIAKKSWLNLILVIVSMALLFIFLFAIFGENSTSILEDFRQFHMNNRHFNSQAVELSIMNLTKPASYKEGFYYSKLPNGVELILINGTKKKKISRNSVGLIVGSGSMQDGTIEGLAHFTEHMLFLGSQKYPNVTFFNDFITSNNGHFNGFTDKDTTSFVYEISKDKFRESLDVFLNFFVKPLFKAEYIEKEISAVNSEYEKNLHSEEKRFDRLFQSLANPMHPYSKFSTGNKDTLKPHSMKLHALREKVIQSFNKHYTSNNIQVVAYGNYEMSYVKNVLIDNLLNIQMPVSGHNKSRTHTDAVKGEIFTEHDRGKIIFFKSRFKTMTMMYFVKDFKTIGQKNSNNPKLFFKKLFAIRHPKSLIEVLITHRLIFNFRCEFKDKYLGLNAISFKFLLTEHGLRNVDLIIRLMSKYIQIIHKNIGNVDAYESIRNDLSKNFNKQKAIKDPYMHLKKWTKNFHLFGPKEFLVADNLLNEFNANIVHDFAKNLTIPNSLIFIGSRSFKNFNESFLYTVLSDLKKENDKSNREQFSENNFLNKKEKWYKTKYAEYKLDSDHIWHIFRRKLSNAELAYPPFAATNSSKIKGVHQSNSLCFNIHGKKVTNKECKKLFKEDLKNTHAILLSTNNSSNNQTGEIFYKLDRTHLKKNFILNVKVSPKPENLDLANPKTVPLMKFLIMYLNFQFTEQKVQSQSPYSHDISVKFMDNPQKPIKLFSWKNSKEKLTQEDYLIDGLYMKIRAKNAYSMEHSDFFSMLTKVMNEDISLKHFLYLKEELYRYIEFYKSSNPSHQALNWLFRLGFKYDIDYFNMTQHIKKIRVNDINEFKKRLFSEVSMKFLAVGTVSKEETLKFSNRIGGIFGNMSATDTLQVQGNAHIPKKSFPPQVFMRSPYTKYGHKFIFQKLNLFKHSPDSTTLNLYFLGENDIHTLVNMKIISNIAGNIFFSYLRIKFQLGYSIKSKLLNINNNLMFYVHVQGSKKHPSQVYHHIDKTVLKIKNRLQALDENSFENIKKLIYKAMTNHKKGLDAKSEMTWEVVLGNEKIFDHAKIKKYIDNLTVADLNKFLDRMVDHRLSIQVANVDTKYEKIDKESHYIGSVNYFRELGKLLLEHQTALYEYSMKPPLMRTFEKKFKK